MRVASIRTYRNQPTTRVIHDPAQSGIALMVVMVVFVVLYLVVYQLHFSTSMEAKIASQRYGEVESSVSMHSTALYVMTLLVEDLKEDLQSASSSSAAPAGAAEGPGRGGEGGGEGGIPGGGDAGANPFAPISLETAGGGSSWYDYIHENIFQENRQQIGDTTVKVILSDGESKFDLNRLFDYVRLADEDVAAGATDIREEDVLAAVNGKSAEDAAKSLRSSIMSKSREKTGIKKKGAEAAAGGKDGAGDEGPTAVGAEGEAGPAAEAASEYEIEEFVPPGPEQLELTRQMVERALWFMFSVNENEYGHRYSQKYSASQLAPAIVDYVLERRRAPYQNRIYLTSELLNVPGVTPEVYYGPTPLVKDGDEIQRGEGFLMVKDEFGDVVPQYLYGPDAEVLAEERKALEELQSQLGRFADLSGMGLGRLQSNPLTRGMSELPTNVDENGREYVVERPVAIGLKDIFTTYSTGKINLNTAPVPVLYALLLSLSEEEANMVALDIRDYRNRYQEETEEDGVSRVADAKQTPDLGQPRQPPKDKEKKTTKETKDAATAAGATPGTDPSLLDSLDSSYQDMETNYFTELRQLELIDGTDGGPNDRLRQDEGVASVGETKRDSLFDRVERDLEKVVVFGSTYFNAELKGKPKEGKALKTGYLTVRRDAKKRVVEVLMWKNLQK
jgi:type II secretory pathway component PulK